MQEEKGPHKIIRDLQSSKRWFCTVCQWSWATKKPQAGCPGVPRYKYKEWPGHLMTATRLNDAGCKPEDRGPVAGACWNPVHKIWMWLYDYLAPGLPPLPANADERIERAEARREERRFPTNLPDDPQGRGVGDHYVYGDGGDEE